MNQAVVQTSVQRGPVHLWPLATLPTSALLVWAVNTGGEAWRWIGLGTFAWALTLPLLASLEAGLVGMMLFEPMRGLIRRAQYIFLPYTQSDPIHLITPLVTAIAFVTVLQRKRLRIFSETPLAKLVSILALIYFLQIFNPLQGGLTVGFSGALFILVPVAWFYFGTAIRPEFVRTALRLMVIMGMLTSLYGVYHLTYGFPSFEQFWIDNTDAYSSIALGNIKRALATYSSAEEWGRYIQLGAIASFGFGIAALRYIRKAGWFICGIALTSMVFLTGQRTAIFGLALGALTLFALGAKSWRGVTARFAIILPLAIVGILAKAPTSDDVLSRDEDDRYGAALSHSARGALNPTEEGSLQERLDTWTFLATEIIPRNPLGLGLGATSLAVNRSDKDSALPPIDSYFISAVITSGLPAALLFLFILVKAMFASWRRTRQSTDKSELQIWRVVAAIMPVLILNSLFGNTFTLYSVAPIAWLIVGWISNDPRRAYANQTTLAR